MADFLAEVMGPEAVKRQIQSVESKKLLTKYFTSSKTTFQEWRWNKDISQINKGWKILFVIRSDL